MIGDLVQGFIASDAGRQVAGELGAQGLTASQGREAIVATAEGAAGHLAPTAGGGGLGGLAGALGGLGGATSTAMPPQAIEGIVNAVATRTGLPQGVARTAVNTVLPKVVEFLRGRVGGVAGAP